MSDLSKSRNSNSTLVVDGHIWLAHENADALGLQIFDFRTQTLDEFVAVAGVK